MLSEQSFVVLRYFESYEKSPGDSFINPQSVCSIFRKHLPPETLVIKIARVFKSAADSRDQRRIFIYISFVAGLLSAFAMFTLKVLSLFCIR